MPKRSQKNVGMNGEEGSGRKGSSGTIKSESGITHMHTPKQPLEPSETLSGQKPSLKVKHISPPCQPSSSLQIRFPKLEEYAHFHYDLVELPVLKLSIKEEDTRDYKHNTEVSENSGIFLVSVTGSAPKNWLIRRTLDNFAMLDKQLHKCIFDRKFSHLEDLQAAQMELRSRDEVHAMLESYLQHFSELAGGMVNCGSVLSWMEMDNRGHRLVATDDSGINTPAIAAAHVIKRYNGQAADEISLQVGDMISVIDMPPVEDTIWWRGKRGFEVGFFPSECVEVIGDKVPTSVTTRIPEPLATSAASRKPCENLAVGTLAKTVNSTVTTTTTTTTQKITPSTSSTPSPSPSRSSTVSAPAAMGTSASPDWPPTMMKKHGKLLSFLRTFFSHRPARNQLKQSGIVKERVFGCDLGEHLLNSGHDVPLLLKSCTEIIEEFGIVHGIYRLSGITSNIQKLRLAFDEDRVPDLTEECYLQDIHSISSLIKMYFRELPNPLLTYQLYDKFADAVRDEDNKLLKIHDVVQQLPPPHYRTTEYLMRHLARVAAFGQETEMHSKNLAIVWAPNLLRSKELEAGGGAAALQGVGIQAVVTECLICYCDIIFSDKMPNYGSQEAMRGQKKPRPKSLAISTPTRLLSLEEARERAFIGHLAPKKFIDVGGGPKNLPSKYHTVIDLPGYRKKVPSSTKENKGKKKTSSNVGTETGGWKSIFSKPRSGSVKKTRKDSVQDSVTLGAAQAKALTEEDVHNWKRRLRSAKSAESLFSLTNTTSSIGSLNSRTSHGQTGPVDTDSPSPSGGLDCLGSKGTRTLFQLSHKRSLSSDASAILQLRNMYHDNSGNGKDFSDMTDVGETTSKQSFVRGDSTRKALHRRVPSAPNTPGQERRSKERRSSMSRDEMSVGNEMDISLEDFIYPKSESRGDVNIDAAIKSRLLQVAEKTRSARSNEELTSSPLKRSAKTPPKGRKKAKGIGQASVGSSEDELSPESCARKVTLSSSDVSAVADGSPYDNEDQDSRMRRFYSRFHDYAEILSDEDGAVISSSTPGSQGTMSVSSSGCNMQEVLDQIDCRLAMNAKFFTDRNFQSDNRNAEGTERTFGINTNKTDTSVTSRVGPGKETEFPVNTTFYRAGQKETEFPAISNTSPIQSSELSGQVLAWDLTVSSQSSTTDNNQQKSLRESNYIQRTNSESRRRRVEGSRKEGIDKPSHLQTHRATDKPNSGSTLIARRHLEFIPSSSATAKEFENLNDLLDSLERDTSHPKAESRTQQTSPSQRSPHSDQSHYHQAQNNTNISPENASIKLCSSPGREKKMAQTDVNQTGEGVGRMSKCLSVPSDIARSLENVTESQCDMLSSITISELSMSVNSFGNGLGDDGITAMSSLLTGSKDFNSRQRRSTSLDSLTESDRLMTRTLREINQQMDAAFKSGCGTGVMMGSDSGNDPFFRHHRLVSSDLDLSSSPESKAWHQPSRTSKPWTNEERKKLGQGKSLTSSNSLGSTDSMSKQLHQSESSLTPTQTCPSYGILSSNPYHKPDDSLQQLQQTCSLPPRKPSNNKLDKVFPLCPDGQGVDERSRHPFSASGPCMSDISSVHVTQTFDSQHSPCQPRTNLSSNQQPQQQRYSFPSAISRDGEMRGRDEERKALHSGMDERSHSLCTLEGTMDKSWDVDKSNSSHQVYLDISQTQKFDFYPKTSHSHTVKPKQPIDPVMGSNPRMDHGSQQGRSDIASVCRNRGLSSSSSSVSSKESEEFDEVASPDDEEGKEEDLRKEKMSSRKMTLPLPTTTNMGMGTNRLSDRPSCRDDLSMFYQVVRRQHSPRVEQRSPIGDSGLPGNQMADLGSCEPISSLCAAGLMSQRVRLSRESSSSSLPSPDSSFNNALPGNVTSPLATPGREALPDIVQSTTQPMGAYSMDNRGRSNLPLQLALYHPDEFSMDIPASVTGHVHLLIPPSSSLPEVHTSSDRVLEKKETLKKSSTDSSISDQMVFPQLPQSLDPNAQIISGNIGATSGLGRERLGLVRESGDVRGLNWSEGNSNICLRFTSNSQNMNRNDSGRMGEGPCQVMKGQSSDISCHDESIQLTNTIGPGTREKHCVQSGKKMSQDREDQVAMEMDNICNRLLDDLSHSQPSDSNFRTMEDQASMEVEILPQVKERQQSCPLAKEKREMHSAQGEVHQSGACSVENLSGQEEQLQNVVNQDREFLRSPDLKEGNRVRTSVAKPPREVASQGSTLISTDFSLPVRKSSFSKIPRPKQNSEMVLSNRSVTGSSRRSETVSSSLHMDTSPSSSSTSSTSSSSRGGHVRRASETSGVSVARRQGHNRRSSDTKLSDLCTDSQTVRSTRTDPSSSARNITSPRGRIGEVKPENMSKSSRIPLSHRVPSPQQGEHSNLGVVKLLSKIPSPVPKPRKKVGAELALPPSEDIMEVTRQSVRRETSRAGSRRDQNESNDVRKGSHSKDANETVAKLVIDSQPELKKKIQTVHAKKVSQPARQVAEAVSDPVELDKRMEETLTVVRFSNQINASQVSHPVESQREIDDNKETVEKKVPPPVAKRKFLYDSRSLPRRSRFTDLQSEFSHQETGTRNQYCDMVGSRSSLDDSVLQLAAERHDLFVPEVCGEQRNYGYSTGSLRAKRSQKMQSLMDLFEHGSDSNMSDSSGSPGTRHRDRTYSGSMLGQSGQLTPCLEVGRGDSDECFLPSDVSTQQYAHSWPSEEYNSSLTQVSPSGKGRTCTDKENMADFGLKAKMTRQSNFQPSSPRGDSLQSRPRVTVPNRSRMPPHSPSSGRQNVSISSPPSSHSRPPRHSKSRTLSESDTSQPVLKSASYPSKTSFSMSASYTSHTEADLLTSPSQDIQIQPEHLQLSQSAPRSEQNSELKKEETNSAKMREKENTRLSQTGKQTKTPMSPRKERRNSIKELRQVFEAGDLQLEEEKGDNNQSSERKGQGQPTVGTESPAAVVSASQSDNRTKCKKSDSNPSPPSDGKTQTLRLGPKPFYGRQK